MAPPTTKVALVTGAARGIGRSIALRLADDGYDVAVNDIPGTPELDELIKEIQSKGRRTLCIPADISLEPEVERIIQRVVQDFGSLDVVSCSADSRDCSVLTSLSVDGSECGNDRLRIVSDQ